MNHDESGSNAARTSPDCEGRAVRDEWSRAENPSTTIVLAVAAATGRDPTALAPLHRHVDVDALDAILTGATVAGRAAVRLSFPYEGCVVAVAGDGAIAVRPDDAAHADSVAGPRTAPELNARLRGLLGGAARNGVAVNGGWEVRNGGDLPDWEVRITRIEESEED